MGIAAHIDNEILMPMHSSKIIAVRVNRERGPGLSELKQPDHLFWLIFGYFNYSREHMKYTVLLALSFAIYIPISANAEYYKVNVKRIEKDLYKTDTGLYIQTQYCYEYTYGDSAILKYEQYSYDNKIIFDSGTSCDIKKVFK